MKNHLKIKKNGMLLSWIISYLIIITIPVFFGLVSLSNTNRILKEELILIEKETAEQVKYLCDGELQAIQKLSSQISSNILVQNFVSQANSKSADLKMDMMHIFNQLQKDANAMRSVESIYVISYTNDHVISSNDGTNTDFNWYLKNQDIWGGILNKETFYEQLESKIHSFFIMENQDGSRSLFYCNIVFSDVRKKPEGIVLIRFQLRDMVNLYSGEGGQICGFVAPGGMWLPLISENILEGSEISFSENDSSIIETIFQGQQYFIVKTNSQMSGYYYFYGMPTDSLTEDLRKNQKQMLLSIGAGALFSICMAIWLAYKNYNPVSRLMHILQENRFRNMINENEFSFIEKSFQEIFHERRTLQETIKNEYSVIVNNLLLRLLKGKFSRREQILDLTAQYQIDLEEGVFVCLLWTVDDYSAEEWTKEDTNLVDLSFFIVRNIAEENLRKRFSFVYAVEIDGMLAFIIQDLKDGIVEGILKESALTQKIISDTFKISTSYFISSEKKEAESLAAAYTECLSSMGIMGSVTMVEDSSLYKEQQKLDQLLSLIQMRDYKNAAGRLRQIMYDYIHSQERNDFEIRLYMHHMFYLVYVNVQQQEDSAGFPRKMEYILNHADTEEVMESMCKYLYSLGEENESKKQKRTELIIAYIDANLYNPDLSINMISEAFQISGSYLSKLLKKELGTNIVNYINGRRIDYVKYLIDNSEDNLVSVSEKAGFYSYRTMIRVFRKVEGMPPSEYRKSSK